MKSSGRPSACPNFVLFRIFSRGGSFYPPPIPNRVKGCYMNEPEYLEKEINAMNILENENFSDNSEESDLDSSRLENLHWCSGFECGIALTMRVQECKYCCECKSLLGDKLKDIKYITSNSEFHIMCLNKIVLETAFTAIDRLKVPK